MSGIEVLQILGAIIAVLTLIGGFVIRDRQVFKAITEGDEKLHQRINRVSDNYVRRDDLNSHITGMENAMKEMRDEQRETNRRIDTVLAAMGKKSD